MKTSDLNHPLPTNSHEVGTELCERTLRDFVERAWPVIEPGTTFIKGWHLDAIADHLQAVTHGQIRQLLINIPPRHMKSLAVCVFWPAWEWTMNPHCRWLFASYAQSLSTRDSVRCRRLIESDWYRSRWGEVFSLTSDQNQKMRYDTSRGGCRIATSVGGAATGEGGDRVVVDDPHNVVDRESDCIRRSTLQWWDEVMSTRLNDPKTGARVIVMQRIHEKDLSRHVLDQGGYVHLCLPAEFESSRRCATSLPWADPRETEGDLLWPERITESEISDFKLRLGPAGYASQFQQRPAPAGGNRFRQEWFRYFTILETTSGASHGSGSATPPVGPCEDRASGPDAFLLDDEDYEAQRAALASTGSAQARARRGTDPARDANGAVYRLLKPDGTTSLVNESECSRFAVMDPAGSEPDQSARPCYTVIQVWDVTPAHDMLLVHQYRAQVQTPDAADAAERIVRRFEPEYLAVEKDGLGLGIVQSLKKRNVLVKPIKARGSKEARSETAEIRMAAGQIYFPHGAPYLWDLEQELIHFPKGEYVDQVDALAHAARLVQVGAPRVG